MCYFNPLIIELHIDILVDFNFRGKQTAEVSVK